MYGFIDIEKLKSEGWELTRVTEQNGEFRTEHKALDDIPPVDAFRALVDYAASLGQTVSIIFGELEDTECTPTTTR